jgi:CrcB protein
MRVRERDTGRWAGTSPEQIDPELDEAQSPGLPHHRHWKRTLAIVAAGGAAGALARYGLSAAFPAVAGRADWATLGINTSGCLVIGIVMAALTASVTPRPLLRAFAVTGVLGGFTTFSTAIVDVQRSASAGSPGTALGYLFGTLVLALAATVAGLAAGGWLVRRLRPGRVAGLAKLAEPR